MTAAEGTTERHPLLRWLTDHLPDPSSFATTAILVPSSAVSAALRIALSNSGHATLGTHVLTAPQFARLVAERSGHAPPSRRPDPLVERALLRGLLRAGGDPWALEFPAAQKDLLRTLRAWQLAGGPPLRGGASAAQAAFHGLATRFDAATWEFATRRNLFRRAEEALGLAASIRPVDRILILDPDPARDVLELTRRLISEHGVEADRYVNPDRRRRADLPTVLSSHPDVEAELRAAAASCLEARLRSVPWNAMVVAVPRLGAYAPWLQRAFRAEGVPCHSDAESPLAREPRVAVAIHAARILFGQPTRHDWLALVETDYAAEPFAADEIRRFDHLSRDFHLRDRGPSVEEFAERQLGQGAHGVPPAPRVGAALSRWSRAAEEPCPGGTRGRIARLRDFLETQLRPPNPVEDPRDATAAELLDATLEAWSDASQIDDPHADAAGFAHEFERILGERGMRADLDAPLHDAVQVLEVQDALARPAAHVHVAGLSEEFWPDPTPVGADAFLNETDRESLGMTTRTTERGTRRALLEALLAHPTDSLVVSRARRRASDGRSVGPSFWLDELDLDGATRFEEATHPLTRARRRVAQGRCPRDLALLRVALESDRPEDLAEIVGTRATHTFWQNARRLESFVPSDLSRDGDVGGDAPLVDLKTRPLSATRLTDLGYCPQRFLFAHEFDLPLLPEEPDPCELPRDRIGIHIHSALEVVYREFDLAGAEDVRGLRDAMVARALEQFEARLAGDRSPLRRDFPTLHHLIEGRWREALEKAIVDDLDRMQQDGSRPIACEVDLRASLRVDGPDGTVEIPARGTADRLDRLAEGGLRVLDFKTGKKPAKDVDWQEVLRLKKPQLAFYAELLVQGPDEATRGVEQAVVRSVRPRALRITDEDVEDPEHPLGKFDGFPDGSHWRGFRESLAIGMRLRARGAFVLDNRDANCRWCKFRTACRRLHPPSAERVARCSDHAVATYMAMKQKTKTRPLLHREEEPT